MKKLLPVAIPSLIALAVASGFAYAQTGSTKSNSALTTEIGGNLPDNTTGQITPFTLRQTLLDMINSSPIACVTEPTATTYTLLTSDYGCLVTFNSNSAITAKLSTPSIFFPFVASINNMGTGAITLSPTGGTINNATTLNVGTSGAIVFSDGSNYKALLVSGSGGGGGSTSPGGSNTQIQYNNASAFGGISGVTTDGASIFALTSTIGSLTATTIRSVGWLTASGVNAQTVTIASLTPGGPNCLQETGGVVQATNAACTTATNTGIAAGTNITTSGTVSNVTVNTVLTPSFTTVIVTGTGSLGGVTSALAAVTGWLTAPGANFQTGSFAGNITGSTGAQFLGQVTGTSAVFQTMTINSLTPGGPNCLQETGGVVQATNGACSSGGVTGGAPGAVALWNSATVLTNDIGITFTSPGQFSLNLGSYTTTTSKALNITANWSTTPVEYDAPLFMNVTTSAVPALGSKIVDLQFNTKSFLTVANTSGSPLTAISYGTNPTAFRIYNTVDDPQNPTNFEAAELGWNFSSNVFTIRAFQGGTGANRDITLSGGGNLNVSMNSLHGISNGWDGDGTYWYANKLNLLAGAGSFSTDMVLYRDALAGATALANPGAPTSPTTLRVYNTTDQVGSNVAPTNYERGVIDWNFSANTLTIGTQQNGTGVGRTVMFVASGTKAISLSPTINLYGQSNPGANETYAVCAGSGATSLTAGGQLFVDTTACLASSMMVKHDIAAFNDYGMTKLASLAAPLHAEHRLANAPIDIDPVAEAMALVPAVATYDTLGSGGPEFTLIAQNVCQVDERLCERTRDGEIRTFKPNSVISILVAAIQKQQHEIDELKRRIH